MAVIKAAIIPSLFVYTMGNVIMPAFPLCAQVCLPRVIVCPCADSIIPAGNVLDLIIAYFSKASANLFLIGNPASIGHE